MHSATGAGERIDLSGVERSLIFSRSHADPPAL